MPYLRVPSRFIGRLHGQPLVMENTIRRMGHKLKPVMDAETKGEKLMLFNLDSDGNDGGGEDLKSRIMEAVLAVRSEQDILPENLSFQEMECSLTYEDWDVKSCLSAVIPEGSGEGLIRLPQVVSDVASEIEEGFSGFATVGHIVHLNLREQLLPYRWVIGRILHDKIPVARYSF